MTAARPLDPMPTTEPSPGPSVRLPAQPIVAAAVAPLTSPIGAVRATGHVEAERAARCSMRPAPRRDPAFDDEPSGRHLRLIRTSATPELPFPATLFPAAPLPAAPLPAKPVPATPLPATPISAAPLPATPVPATPGTADTNRRRLTLVTAPVPPAAQRPGPIDMPTSAKPDRSVDRPDPTRFGRQFAQGAIEVLSGRRPMVQLTRHVSPAVQRGLARAGADQPLSGAVTPLLHSLHLSEPADGVCEMSAIVVVGPRYRALAARLEWKIDHWRCTALQLG